MSGIVSWWRLQPTRIARSVFRLYALILCLMSCLVSRVPERQIVAGAPVARDAFALDAETIAGMRHFTHGYPADHPDGSVNAVVEIPSGTTAKFEVGDDGWMHWKHDRDDGSRREIDYLPFLVNYGMVPRTLAPDGDPLDIVVLARGIERGRIARTRVIGVLVMLDDGEIHDDKLIAVPLDDDLRNGFSDLHDLDELDLHYVAVRQILWTWFASYWGHGVTNVVGWGDAAAAAEILDEAKRAFTAEQGRKRPLAASALHRPAALPFAALAR